MQPFPKKKGQPSRATLDVPPLQSIRQEASPKKSNKKKRKTTCLEEPKGEGCRVGILDLIDDPTVKIGYTLDIEMRFRVRLSSMDVKEKVVEMGSTSFERCLQCSLKFINAPRSVIQHMIDYVVEVYLLLELSFFLQI